MFREGWKLLVKLERKDRIDYLKVKTALLSREGMGNNWECHDKVTFGVPASVHVTEDHKYFILKVWEYTKSYKWFNSR